MDERSAMKARATFVTNKLHKNESCLLILTCVKKLLTPVTFNNRRKFLPSRSYVTSMLKTE